MAKKSAGLLMFRETGGHLEVLLVHPGGPFWSRKDLGAWSIPKGEFNDTEDPLSAARREFEEETGFRAEGEVIALESCRQPSGKMVYIWAVKGDLDVAKLKSNLFSMEWPPKSGRMADFPEADRAEWFSIDAAREKIIKGQLPFLERLAKKVRITRP